jgi:hypothetical protein
MKKTQYNTPLGIPKDILHLKDYEISCKNINKDPADPPVFSIRINSDILENILCLDLEDCVKMNRFLKNAVNNTKQ